MNLKRSDAAAYLGLSLQTLDNWRCLGRGPKFLKLGARVVYPQNELDAFMRASLRSSTTETRAA